jgi:ribosomal-protein-alanine N-acetyltransferase
MPGPVFMRGNAVTFHPVEEDDLEFLQELINHPDVREGISSTRPVSMADEREWFESDEEGVQFLVAADGERVGTMSFRATSDEWGTTELAYFFDPGAWGNGYATDAVDRMVEYAFEERRLAKVWARAFAFNDASQRVLEKVGFEQEGRLREQAFARGERVDMLRFGLLADEWRDDR